ncbi:contactin-1-like isoform X2 [Carassius auratus]|uniref:Contactin-1-like isoform X2 n=1 Tax=Carassius auratus TaxID=7957 RepID=A0A6P6J4M0_CARAU|nr:contactin-1-like isoform X2 [Carassius auratus]
MKSALTVVLFRLFTIGVCVDGYEVSVTEGDSVTLKSGVTELKTLDEIEWMFNGTLIATISRGDSGISVWVKADGSFRDRLELDNQTGDLKISNISTTDSGEYKPLISSPSGSPPEVTFTVKVVPAAVKSVSVLKGDTVTLQTGLTEIQRDDVIQWRFGQQKSPVAEINRKAGNVNTVDTDERFRGRLKLDQTGSLTINNTRTTDSGLYEVEISSSRSRHTRHYTRSFSLTVRDYVEKVSVLKRDSVTLHTGLTGTDRIEQIRWTFGDDGKFIADLNGPANQDNFGLNKQTGDLIIRNIQTDQSGDYKVEINTRTMILHRKYKITVVDSVEPVLVLKGDNVTLRTGLTGTERIEQIRWTFGDDEVIADLNGPDNKDNFGLNKQTGDLIIRNIQTDQSGDYKVEINTRTMMFHRKYKITVIDSVEPVSVLKGDNVTLHTYLTGTERIEQIRWTFGDDGKFIADLNGPANKDNFGLNKQTGVLTIRNIQADQKGLYKVEIKTRTMMFHRKYQITVIGPGWSSGAVAGFSVGSAAVVAAACLICYCYKKYKNSSCRYYDRG